MAISVGRKLQILEAVTGKKGPFWTEELKLGRDLWRQWRLGRNQNAVLKREHDLKLILEVLGFKAETGFLADADDSDEAFEAKLSPRALVGLASHYDMDLHHMPSAAIDRLPDGFRQLRAFGRVERSGNVGMIIGPNRSATRAALTTWLKEADLRPLMPVIHLDARRYADASALLARILELIAPEGRLSDTGSTSEQIALFGEIVQERQFALIIEHVDFYRDTELYPEGDDFRIGMQHFLLSDIIYGRFLFSEPRTAARLMLTARSPLHSLSHGPFTVVRVPGSLLSIAEEGQFHDLDRSNDGTAEATIRKLADLFPPDAAELQPSAQFGLPSWSGPSSSGDAIAIEAMGLISSLPPPEKLFLRLLATSMDGLRRETMERVMDENAVVFRPMIPSADDIERIHKFLAPLVWEGEDMTTRNGSTIQVSSEGLRRCLIAEWEDAEIDVARRIYRQIGIIAFQTAEAARSSATRQAVAKRYIQAARCLLASIDPERGGRFSNRLSKTIDEGASSATIADWLKNRGTNAGAVNDFIYQKIWLERLEDGGNYRLIRSHGLVEAKIGLLQSFLRQGTLTPMDLADVVSREPNSVGYLTNFQHIRILTEIAVAAGRAGRNDMMLAVARQAKTVSNVPGGWQRTVFKILSDSLLRAGCLEEARQTFTEAIEKLVEDRSGGPANRDARTTADKFKHECAVDFLCRQGEAFTLTDELGEARRCFEDARARSARLASGGDGKISRATRMEGANGRRYVRFLIAEACRNPYNRLVHLGNAQTHVRACLESATVNGWEHDIASLSIDGARLSRLDFPGSHTTPTEILDNIKRAEELTRSFGVSGISAMEALAERARTHSLLSAIDHDAENQRSDGRKTARQLLESARASKLPVFEAEALLLLLELKEGRSRENLEAHDAICASHGFRVFEHPRALIVHGANASKEGAW